ncbi:hypothetical protein CRE_15423 [Caenorhabditis remanei]|uniref:UBX domain-containing protein n=1 Tax=Caenorhabditis remanei TaxID=31234 RepID=E3MCA3_CAERE|nr:hypothetical protein CRE_15423 [Caenorhabditis remanei]
MDETQQAAVAQMKEITNCNEDTAMDYLFRTNFDVEIAVRHFFEGTIPATMRDERTPTASTPSSSVTALPSPTEERTSSTSSTSRPGPVLPRYHSLIQFLAEFFTLPVRLPLIMLNYVYNYFFGVSTPVYTHIFDYLSKEFPQYDANKKSVFYKHQLQSLRNDLPTKNWKWLVAYIHDPNGSPDFLHSLFVSNFAEQVRTRGGVFFGCVMGSPDAAKLRPDSVFGRKRKNCVIVFVIKATSLTRKLMIEDLSNPQAVATNIDLALIDLITDEADRILRSREQNEARRLMEEQNREYQESLQRDMERIAKSKSEEEAAKRAQEEEERKQKETENRVEKVEKYKKSLLEDDTPSTGAHDLLIRFPTGKKVIKFNGDDSIEKIFQEALKSEMCPLFFQMHQSFPKKAVPCLPQWYFEILTLEELEPKEECLSNQSTFEQSGITHGSMVYIDNL